MPKVYLTGQDRREAETAARQDMTRRIIRGACGLQGINQNQLAEKLGMCRSSLSHKLNHNRLTLEELCGIVRVLRLQTEDVEVILGIRKAVKR